MLPVETQCMPPPRKTSANGSREAAEAAAALPAMLSEGCYIFRTELEITAQLSHLTGEETETQGGQRIPRVSR